jgi:hypothetical protein
MVEAYSRELSSVGFWAGNGVGEAAFYAYAYPAPQGYSQAKLSPKEAYYHESLGEFILPYEAVRSSSEPDAALMSFLQSSYEAAADLAQWDRESLDYSSEFARLKWSR